AGAWSRQARRRRAAADRPRNSSSPDRAIGASGDKGEGYHRMPGRPLPDQGAISGIRQLYRGRHGRQHFLLFTHVPWAIELRRAGLLHRRPRNHKFTVGEFAIGRVTGRNVLHFALPFYGDDGRMGGVVIAALSLDWLAQYIMQKGVPPGTALAIGDHNGTYLARYPDNDRFVGRKMPLDQYPRLDQLGTTATRDVDGVERIVAYSALPADSGGLFVTFGLDKALAFSEIQQRTWLGVSMIVLSTSLALVLTWFGAQRFIHRPLGQLVGAANQWRLGDYAPRVHIRD